jgi:Flp pilus assembly secretin CpaC
MRFMIAATVSCCWRALMAAVMMVTVLGPSFSAAAERMIVILDQAKITKIHEGASTIVVGNPLIADVTIEPGAIMVVTGKGYGITNVIALNRTGQVLDEILVQVRGPADSVVVYHGVARESYNCAPNCERRITLGDTSDYFAAALAETANRSARAQQGEGLTAGGAPPPP